jgi:hypothetical protein
LAPIDVESSSRSRKRQRLTAPTQSAGVSLTPVPFLMPAEKLRAVD